MPRKQPRPPWAGHPPRGADGHAPAPTALGIDIGRVIISAGDSAGDTSFLGGNEEAAMATPPSPEAFESIARLVAAFDGRAWLVSKCGPGVEARTRRWLAHWRFHEHTGLRTERVRFCRERRDKAVICARLGIDAFIDDRTDVLAAMAGVVPWRYLFGPQTRPVPEGLVAVRDWSEVRARLLPASPDA